MSSASPGERAAVQSYCAGEQTSLTRNLCVTNQMATIQRLGLEPAELLSAETAKREDR